MADSLALAFDSPGSVSSPMREIRAYSLLSLNA